MILHVLVGFGAAIIGACAGSFVTWRLARRSAHLDRCQRQLERACQELQRYRVVYAQFYAEYLSAAATGAKGSWAQPVSDRPDMDYLKLMSLVDETRGSLCVQRGILRSMLQAGDGARAYELIHRVLHESSDAVQRDPKFVDELCNRAMDELIELIPTR